MALDVATIKKVREETGASVVKIKNTLDDVKGDTKKAIDILKKEGFEKMAKRTDRETGQGRVFSYIHHSGKVGSLVELLCETDFVAKNELFEKLGKDLAMQAASMGEKDLEDQDFIKDPKKKISELVKELMNKTGENIKIGKVVRIQI